MKKLNLTLMLLTSLIFLGCNDTNKNNFSETDDIQLEVTLERNLSSEHPLDIIVKLTNLGEHTVYYANFSLPNEDRGIDDDYFTVREDGVKVEYKGILASQGNTVFTSLVAGETKIGKISLDRHYEVHQGTHHYEISRSSYGVRAKTIDGTEEAFHGYVDDFPDALAPDAHTSEYILVKQNNLDFEATLHTVRELIYKKY